MSVTPARRSDAARPYSLPRDRPVSHGRLFTAEGLVLVLLAALALAAHTVRGALPSDLGIMETVQQLLAQKQLTSALEAFSTLGWPQYSGPLLGVVVVILFLARHRLAAVCLLGVVLCADGSYLLLADIVRRPRPVGPGIHVLRAIKNYYSFPSGHVEHFTVFCCFLIFLTLGTALRMGFSAAWIVPLRAVLVLTIAVMGLSRVLEGEHWPTDVVAGYLLGAFWVVVAIHVYRWLWRRWPEGPGADGANSAGGG